MGKIREFYVGELQFFAHQKDVWASIWTFRTIRDLRSLRAPHSEALTTSEKAAVLGRGVLALLAWLPVNIIAIPHVFIQGGLRRLIGWPRPRHQLDEIAPGLYLGTDRAARDFDRLSRVNISAILSIQERTITIPNEIPHHKRLHVEDYPHSQIRDVFDEAYEFVREQHEAGRTVLIHCNMGMSRSATVAAAVLARMNQSDSNTALKEVQSRRSIIDPNYGFRRQLKE